MNNQQKKVIELLKQQTPEDELKPWVKGRIPAHYKRLSISMEEATELATAGASASLACFGTGMYFTQALITGAALSRKYDRLVIVTPSQYGKSWTCGQIALMLANRDEPTYIAGSDNNTTEIIMGKVLSHVQTADESLTRKLLDTPTKLEKLQASVSKRKLSFKGGGLVEPISLGETYSDAKKGNSAIGRGGNFILDEASRISDDVYAEMGRREFAQEGGERFISIEISNPHNPGWFMDALTASEVPEGTLIIWMDCLTALEEGRIKSRKQILNSSFFKNKSTCTRYLLCELDDYSEESMFPEPVIDDSEPDLFAHYYMGIDSAYKGKDRINAVVGVFETNGMVRAIESHIIEKVAAADRVSEDTKWVDGKSSQHILKQLRNIIIANNVRTVCIDSGYGVYIIEGLVQMCPGVAIYGVEFGSGTTKVRKVKLNYSAVYGENKRAEMHMDVQNLMEEGRMTYSSQVAELIADEMRAVMYTRKPNGKTQIIAKKEIKKILGKGKSPDILDSALLMVHAIILDSLHGVVMPYTDNKGEEEVYDPIGR